MAGNLFGGVVLGVAQQPAIARFAARSTLTQGLVRRFVAGETLDAALDVVRRLNAGGIRATLNHLGEHTASSSDAVAATDEAIHALEGIRFAGLDANISIKLTQLGIDSGEYLVLDNMHRLLTRAQTLRTFVRVDMEGSTHTARTIEIYRELRRTYENVGLVLQADLYRTYSDAVELTALGTRIRLCKGAYSEPPHIAFRRKRDTDRNYVRVMEYLLSHGHFPALATHDARIIERAKQYARDHGIAPDRFEFQMLYGVRRDLQDALVAAGYGVRVYVPYGSQWYPYLTRRLAERPANLLFLAGNLLREGRSPEVGWT